MKNLIKRILKEESGSEKDFIKYFKIIDKIFNNNKYRDKHDLLNQELYSSSDAYDVIYTDFVDKFGFQPKEANLIIGSYIETNLSNNQYYNETNPEYDNGIVISKPKNFVATFSRYISGRQEGKLLSANKSYSRQEATHFFRQGYDGGYEITDDNTETDEFDIEDVFEE